jgi:hypothetical protein
MSVDTVYILLLIYSRYDTECLTFFHFSPIFNHKSINVLKSVLHPVSNIMIHYSHRLLCQCYISSPFFYILKGPSLSWLHGSWIFNYLCNKSVPITTKAVSLNPAQAKYPLYNILWCSLSVTYSRFLAFSAFT